MEIESKEHIHCKFCQITEELQWNDEMNDHLRLNSHCFNCQFWFDKVNMKNEPNVCRIYDEESKETHHYTFLENNNSNKGFKGFGGRPFTIQFNETLRIIKTNNLWHQGTIPERFSELLPINAKFVYEKDLI